MVANTASFIVCVRSSVKLLNILRFILNSKRSPAVEVCFIRLYHRRVNVSYGFLYFSGIFSSHIFYDSARTIDRCKFKFFTPQKTKIYAAFLSNHTFLLDLSDKGIYIWFTNTMYTKENSFGKINKLYYASTSYSRLFFFLKGLIYCYFFTTE